MKKTVVSMPAEVPGAYDWAIDEDDVVEDDEMYVVEIPIMPMATGFDEEDQCRYVRMSGRKYKEMLRFQQEVLDAYCLA